jgi:hypothetical protein
MDEKMSASSKRLCGDSPRIPVVTVLFTTEFNMITTKGKYREKACNSGVWLIYGTSIRQYSDTQIAVEVRTDVCL